MLALTFENIFGREDTVRCIPVRMRCQFILLRLASPEFAGSGSEIGDRLASPNKGEAIKVKYSLSFRKWKTKMQQNISKFGNHRNWQGGDGRSAIFISSKLSIVNLKSQHVIKYIATTYILVQKMSCYMVEFSKGKLYFFMISCILVSLPFVAKQSS